jgi:hypothetical protein
MRHSCRRWEHQTALIDGRLYIDGGQVAYKTFANNQTSMLLETFDACYEKAHTGRQTIFSYTAT